ncbi:MAG: ParB/RepB/Spo0J family partition protein [Porphyromonadaceae bacterium]|nr:ParB/RepB/Spo0J family partition protein [Porphyromonadaceae bacterium]
MSKKHKPVLGRGLNALLGGGSQAIDTETILSEVSLGDSPEASTLQELPLGAIVPNKNQPRREFDQDSLEELAASIRHLGLIQPITVQPLGDGCYQIISGERRYRAAQMAGVERIPVYMRQVEASELLELALVENIQREDLNAIEIALAYQELLETTKLTHEALAERVGKKRATISNYLRLLRLPSQVQLGLSQRLLDMGHARALLQIEDAERLIELYQMILDEQLSVREVEEIARAIKEGEQTPAPEAPIRVGSSKTQRREDFKALEKHLGKVFDSRVSLSCSTKGKGRISIPFASEEDLERIILLLERIQQT